MQIAPNGKMRQASRKVGRLSHFCCKLDAWGLQTFAIPSIPSLVKICDAFQITLSEFFAKAEGSESAPVVLTPQQMQVMEKWSVLRPDQRRNSRLQDGKTLEGLQARPDPVYEPMSVSLIFRLGQKESRWTPQQESSGI